MTLAGTSGAQPGRLLIFCVLVFLTISHFFNFSNLFCIATGLRLSQLFMHEIGPLETFKQVGQLLFQNREETYASEKVIKKHTKRLWLDRYQNLIR